jgi:SPX domain protein involved in polyphosphate accumulation
MADDPLAQFTERLDAQVEKINDFYMDRIEEGVIILHAMTQQVDVLVAHQSADTAQIAAIQRALVSYHFNLLMLQNYVALNFSGIVKILKKLDKKFGSAHRKAYLESIVELPFYNCAALGQVVEDTESLFAKLDAAMSDATARLKVPCGQPGTSEQVDGRQGAPMAQSV